MEALSHFFYCDVVPFKKCHPMSVFFRLTLFRFMSILYEVTCILYTDITTIFEVSGPDTSLHESSPVIVTPNPLAFSYFNINLPHTQFYKISNPEIWNTCLLR